MKIIEVWGEGFACTGTQSPACKFGEYEAKDFDDAVSQYMQQNPKIQIDIRKDNEGNTFYANWGCRLYDNESDARKGFG